MGGATLRTGRAAWQKDFRLWIRKKEVSLFWGAVGSFEDLQSIICILKFSSGVGNLQSAAELLRADCQVISVLINTQLWMLAGIGKGLFLELPGKEYKPQRYF